MNGFNNDTIDRVDEQLEREGFVAIYWHIDDVKSLHPELSDAQALAVLKRAKDTEHDEDPMGINLLRETAEILFGPEVEQLKKPHLAAADSRPMDIHEMLARHHEIADIWSVADVLTVRADLTRDQAWQTLLAVKRQHNAEIGISWDVLDATAESLFGPSAKLPEEGRPS